ncbi:MAG: hypothetical protein RLZZ219_1308 [Cyanobacteriota bacterium]
MVEPLSRPEARLTPASHPSSDQITEQLGRLIPLVNGSRRVARVDGLVERSGLPSLLSWDEDGQLRID